MKFIHKTLEKLPKALLISVIITCLYGFLILYSAGHNNLFPWAYKQLINFAIFIPVMLLITNLNIRTIYNYSYIFYFFILFLLILVELFGYKAMGATRWLVIGGLRIQPSELAKIAVVLFLSRYFSDISYEKVTKIRYLIIPTIAVLLQVGLVIKQPDLGTGMVLLIVSASMFYISGVKNWKFVVLFFIIGFSSPFIWANLHDYQKKRVEVFLNPENDPLGSGYNIIQSKIAIGSGGLLGNGLGKGSQAHLSFLPERQTDFIFSCLAEDLGFVGVFVLFLLYFLIIYFSMSISANSRSLYAKILTAGITSIFFAHIFVNIGMVSGVLPVVGIPLPLISYGGTIMASILMGFGIIMNVHKNKYTNI